MSTFVIVGRSFHTLRSYLKDHGHDYITLKDARLVKNPHVAIKRRIVCDFTSDEAVLAAAREARDRFKPDGILTTYENYILPAAKIAAELGLPGIPVESAAACTDKQLMRALFAQSRMPISPDFSEVSSEEHVRHFAETHQFPLILKPANLAKSLLVTKSNSMEELLENFRDTTQKLQDVYQKYAPNRTPKLILEEYLDGTVHSVDAFVDSSGTPHVLHEIVDYQTGYDIGFEDNFHYSRLLPSRLSAAQQSELRDVAAEGCRALKMANSPAHIEIIFTRSGPKIVEIGARNGGYRERMHLLANGIDITGNALRVSLGQTPGVTASRQRACAVLELFPRDDGVFDRIDNEELLLALPSLEYYSLKATPGEMVGKASNGFKMCAIVILVNDETDALLADLATVTEKVLVATSSVPDSQDTRR